MINQNTQRTHTHPGRHLHRHTQHFNKRDLQETIQESNYFQNRHIQCYNLDFRFSFVNMFVNITIINGI